MEERKIQFVDRLRDRGFIDQWFFVIFATVGFAAILSAKWLGAETFWIAAGAVLLMFVYAIIVGWTGTGRVRADQAGDNCYYLGLIYTLASLSYAIATFDPNDTASTIVQGFGIALATTICGLILRVFFNQGRPDLENVEEQARLELTEASSRLKTELGLVVRQMKDFSVAIQQSLRETHEAATESMEQFTKSSVDGLQSVVDTANEAIRAEANDFAARAKKYDSSFTKLLDKLDAHSNSLEGVTSAHEKLKEAAELTQSAVGATNASLNGLVEGANEAKSAVTEIRESSNLTRQAAENISKAVDELERSIRAVAEETGKQLENLSSGPSQIVTSALVSIKEASANLAEELEKLSSSHNQLADGLTDHSKAAFERVEAHNRALDTELEKSRAATMRVHNELVATTEKLARHVEGHA